MELYLVAARADWPVPGIRLSAGSEHRKHPRQCQDHRFHGKTRLPIDINGILLFNDLLLPSERRKQHDLFVVTHLFVLIRTFFLTSTLSQLQKSHHVMHPPDRQIRSVVLCLGCVAIEFPQHKNATEGDIMYRRFPCLISPELTFKMQRHNLIHNSIEWIATWNVYAPLYLLLSPLSPRRWLVV